MKTTYPMVSNCSASGKLNPVQSKFSNDISFIQAVVYNSAARSVIRVEGHCTHMWKHLHDRILSLRWEACAHKTSLALPLFIQVLVPSQESE